MTPRVLRRIVLLVFVSGIAGMIVGSTQIAARGLGKVPPRMLMVPGLLVAAGALAITVQVGTEPAYASHILPGMLMLGLGMGTAMMTSVSLAGASRRVTRERPPPPSTPHSRWAVRSVRRC